MKERNAAFLESRLADLLEERSGGRSLYATPESRQFKLAHLRVLNLDILLQLGFYLVFFSLVLYGLITGIYIQYIHPRYKIYLVISLFLLAGMFAAQLPRLWQANLRPQLRAYLWLILPAFLFVFLLQPDLQTLALTKASGLTDQSVPELTNGAATTPGAGRALGQNGADEAEELPKIEGAIPIDHLHYAAWLLDLNQNPQKYVGKTYTYLARIEQPEAAGKDEFLPGRPVMLCCAADTQSLGVPAKLTEAASQHLGSWAYVTGTIYMGRGIDPRFPNEQGAWLNVTDVRPAPAPANLFVYYFGAVEIPEK